MPLSPQVQGWREHIQKKASLLSACSGFHHLSHNFISCQSLKPLSGHHLSLLCSALPKATVRRGFQNLPSLDLPSQGTTSASSAPSHSHLGHLPLSLPSMHHARFLLTPAFQHLSSLSMSSPTTPAQLQCPASSTSLHRWHGDYSLLLFCGNTTLQASPSATFLYVYVYI